MLKTALYYKYRLEKIEAEIHEIKRWAGQDAVKYQNTLGDAGLMCGQSAKEILESTKWRWSLLGKGQARDATRRKVSYKRARAIVADEERIYVGYDAGKEGLASVWVLDPSGWRLLGGNGLADSWNHGHEIQSLAFDAKNGLLYAGLCSHAHGPEVWRYDGISWSIVGGPSLGTWGAYPLFMVSALICDDGVLYAALGTGKSFQPKSAGDFANVAPIYRLHDGTWTRVADGTVWGMANPYNCIYELWKHTDGHIYAGTFGSLTPDLGHVWRLRDDFWEQVGGNGIRNSWTDSGHVLRFQSFRGQLICCMNRFPQAPGNFSSVWAFDQSSWKPVGINNVPEQWGNLYSFNALEVFGDTLLVGSGGRPAGNAALWYLDQANQWRLFAGHGKNGSWSPPLHRKMTKPLARHSPTEYVYRTLVVGNRLIVGFGASSGNGQIWECRPA